MIELMNEAGTGIFLIVMLWVLMITCGKSFSDNLSDSEYNRISQDYKKRGV